MKEKEEKNVGEKNKKKKNGGEKNKKKKNERRGMEKQYRSLRVLIFLSHIFLFYRLFMPFMEAYEPIRPDSE